MVLAPKKTLAELLGHDAIVKATKQQNIHLGKRIFIGFRKSIYKINRHACRLLSKMRE
jgi:hypothetical protein